MYKCIISILLFIGISLFANEADVLKVDVKKTAKNEYSFSVTILHEDEGWNHYVNKWEVVGEDDVLYGKRILLHPHVNEQPFTRNLSNVKIPENINTVIIRAFDSMHEYGGKTVKIELP